MFADRLGFGGDSNAHSGLTPPNPYFEKKMKKPEKEYAKLSHIPMLRGGECIIIEMVISAGKFAALTNALAGHETPVAKDLLDMLMRGVGLGQKEIKDYYPNGECPDCGHVFCQYIPLSVRIPLT